MKVVLTLSGGLDSTTLLYECLSKSYKVRCLSVDYGQRHSRELLSAQSICNTLGITHKVLDLRHLKELFAGSSQTSSHIPVPEGHYAEESMKATIVPNRNMVLLSLATAWAISLKYDAVMYAAHAGDHAIYPDCCPDFSMALEEAISLCDWHKISLRTPYIYIRKRHIVKKGEELKVPFEQTWSCYNGRDRHCGKCGTCVERKEAFALANVNDPTEYEIV